MLEKLKHRITAIKFATCKRYLSIRAEKNKDDVIHYTAVTNMEADDALIASLMVSEAIRQVKTGTDDALDEAREILEGL